MFQKEVVDRIIAQFNENYEDYHIIFLRMKLKKLRI